MLDERGHSPLHNVSILCARLNNLSLGDVNSGGSSY